MKFSSSSIPILNISPTIQYLLQLFQHVEIYFSQGHCKEQLWNLQITCSISPSRLLRNNDLYTLCRATKITLAICCRNVLARIYKKNSIHHRPNALRNSRGKNNPRERALLPLRETQPCAS